MLMLRADGKPHIVRHSANKRILPALILICMLTLAAAASMSGCTGTNVPGSGTEKGNTEMEKRKNMTLVGAEYHTVNGMMYGADLHLTIRNDRIVYARYFDPAREEETSAEREDYKTKEDTAISREEWQTLQEAIEPLLPLLKEVVPKKPDGVLEKSKDYIFATDGPNESGFYLTWQREDGTEERTQYFIPNDRRFSTVLTIMEEIANPIGREIVYYDPPELNGIYMKNHGGFFSKKKHYSYQLTFDTALPDEEPLTQPRWRLNAYYYQDGVEEGKHALVTEQIWKPVQKICEDLELDQCPSAAWDDKVNVTLYYTDGKYQIVRPDKQTMEALRVYFDELVRDIGE